MGLFARHEDPHWRLEHELLYVNIGLRGEISSAQADRRLKSVLMAAVGAAHGAVRRYSALTRQRPASTNDTELHRFLDAISVKEPPALWDVVRVATCAYANRAVRDRWPEDADAVLVSSGQVLGVHNGIEEELLHADVTSLPRKALAGMFRVAGASDEPVEVERWAQVFESSLGALNDSYEANLEEQLDDPSPINEVAPLWGEYKRMKRRGEIPDD